jgi:hypothetical protein
MCVAYHGSQVDRQAKLSPPLHASPGGLATPPSACYPSGMPDDDATLELERLRAENERLRRTSASRGMTIKVSEKGGVSVYGLGRFPVTLYKEQWLRLLDMADEIRGFIADNAARLKSKD